LLIRKIEDGEATRIGCSSLSIFTAKMSDSDPKVGRSKKSDKAKEKAGRPSSKFVRLKEAMMEKVTAEPSRKKKNS
jgi:hypothetical protein